LNLLPAPLTDWLLVEVAMLLIGLLGKSSFDHPSLIESPLRLQAQGSRVRSVMMVFSAKLAGGGCAGAPPLCAFSGKIAFAGQFLDKDIFSKKIYFMPLVNHYYFFCLISEL
jgi:hypothetical protein